MWRAKPALRSTSLIQALPSGTPLAARGSPIPNVDRHPRPDAAGVVWTNPAAGRTAVINVPGLTRAFTLARDRSLIVRDTGSVGALARWRQS